MDTLQKPTIISHKINTKSHGWRLWKLISQHGRQQWIFKKPQELGELDASSPEYKQFLQSMADDFKFDKKENPNASDMVYTNTIEERSSQRTPDWLGDPLHYPSSLSMKAARSGYLGIERLGLLQHSEGYWPGDYGGPMFLLPALIFASHVSSTPFPEEKKVLMVQYMMNHQNSDGGWGLHIEGTSTMFGTVMQYCALRILGLGSNETTIKRARKWIIKKGGAVGIPSWGKYFLALLGVYEWEGCNSLFPELWLLPKWAPLHPWRYWCHARMVYLPLAYCYGQKIQGNTDSLIGELRKELYIEQYDSIHWNEHRNDVAATDLFKPMSRGLRFFLKLLNLYEKNPVKRWRKRSLGFVLDYINAEDNQTNYIDIGPVNQILNSICCWHAYGPNSEQFKKHVERWDDYLWLAEDGMKMNGYNGSQLWDTTFTVQAILENPDSGASAKTLAKAYNFIEQTQIKEEVQDRQRFFRHPSVGGWPFSTKDHGWPISDCTAEGLKAVLKLHRIGAYASESKMQISDQRLQQAVDLILSFQNKDGGWGTYENQRSGSWLEYLNPSDIFGEIMVDYSWVECSSACITALVEYQADYPEYRKNEISDAIRKGVRFLKEQQRDDGSWVGSWGVCFTYGTWFGVEALAKSRAYADVDAAIERACEFLVSKQRSDGGWGESYHSCSTGEYVDHESSQVVQTSWALLALMAANYPEKSKVKLGISFLIERQLIDGSWAQQGISGVFNKTCMITYSAYRNVFPIWALERYAGSYSRFLRKEVIKT